MNCPKQRENTPGKASSPNNQDAISGKGGETQLPDFTELSESKRKRTGT